MEPLSDAIEQALCELHQLDRTVSGFKESSQMLLFERMNNLVKALDNVQQVAGETDCHIPMEIFQFVDNGQNPDQYTREFLEGCIARNEATRGKVVAFRSLRKHLLEEIDAVFPEQADAYRSLRTASSKNLPSSLTNGSAQPLPEPVVGTAVVKVEPQTTEASQQINGAET